MLSSPHLSQSCHLLSVTVENSQFYYMIFHISIILSLVLLDAPTVTLQQTGEAGQLQASWSTQGKCLHNVMHRIRYIFKGLGERTDYLGLDIQIPETLIEVYALYFFIKSFFQDYFDLCPMLLA